MSTTAVVVSTGTFTSTVSDSLLGIDSSKVTLGVSNYALDGYNTIEQEGGNSNCADSCYIDIVENPQYVKDNNLKIDYMYYLEHQIENPVGQIFSLYVKRPSKILEDVKRKFNNKKLGNRTINEFFKRVQK